MLESGERAPHRLLEEFCEKSDFKSYVPRHPGDRYRPDLLGRHAQRANNASDGAGSTDAIDANPDAGHTADAAAFDAAHAEHARAADRDVTSTVFAIADQQPDSFDAVAGHGEPVDAEPVTYHADSGPDDAHAEEQPRSGGTRAWRKRSLCDEDRRRPGFHGNG